MSSKMKLSRIKLFTLGLLTLFIIGLLVISYTDYQIQKLIQEKRFLVPTQYYSSPTKFYRGQVKSITRFKEYFAAQNYRERPFGSKVLEGDYSLGDQQQCQQIVKEGDEVFQCLFFRPRYSKKLNLISLNELDQIIGVYQGEDLLPSVYAQAEADLFAQYLGNNPTQQVYASLGDIPRYCLDAVLAIEDPQFLEHKGISVRGLIRAVVANLRKVRFSQGGSTITQQLVKNYFLTPEKTITRKLKEIIISLIFEFRVSKDDILETYLNIIYLGQSGVFEVRGYASASDFYFQKELSDLNLAECALMAAIVNSPGRYNPIRKPEKAKARRERVLSKMVEHDLITPDEMQEALKGPLPTKMKTRLSASAPYYVDAVNKKLKELGIKDRSGLRVYTALDPVAQQQAQKAVVSTIEYFEKGVPSIVKIKEEKKLDLQASLLASNPINGDVVAIVGGRSFASSPYNRAIESQRQVGSIFKPLVYLTALQQVDSQGSLYSPLSRIENSPFTLEYDRQIWEPKNYDGTFSDPLPLFFALKESKNIPTARLAMEVGLDKIIATARNLGVESPLKEYPSLALGAFEIKPLEVLKAYNTISQMGLKQDLQIVKLVSNLRGDILYIHEPYSEQVGNPSDFGVLIGMMKETLISGTGAYSRKMGFRHIAAGKTGTTSDTRDAWFAGFTPFHTAVVWMGYDDGTSHKMTGASGALPIWTNYMREMAKSYADRDFSFPDSVYKETINLERLMDLGVPEEKAKDTELVFKSE
jgi:penicillin-binding protein 1B